MSRCSYLFICSFNTIKVSKSASEEQDKWRKRITFLWSMHGVRVAPDVNLALVVLQLKGANKCTTAKHVQRFGLLFRSI